MSQKVSVMNSSNTLIIGKLATIPTEKKE